MKTIMKAKLTRGTKMSTLQTFDESKIDLIKTTICKGSTNEELELFIYACKRTGLDPFMKQIYAVKRWNGKTQRNEMSIQTGIDGFRLIAERTGKYAPGKETIFEYSEDRVISSTAYIKKMTPDGTWHEVSGTAFYDEYVQTTKEGEPTSFWKRMPHVMLAKCAESIALRRAFPAELSGLYTIEEMSQSHSEEIPEKVTEVKPSLSYDLNDLKEEVEKAGLETDEVEGYIEHLSKKTSKDKSVVIQAALENKDRTKHFMGFYEKWKREQDSIVPCYSDN